MSADVLSDVLRAVRLTGAVFFEMEARSPWVVESLAKDLVLPKILPGGQHLIAFHVITEGGCVAHLIDEEPVALAAGNVIVFTRGDAHRLASAPGLSAKATPRQVIDEATSSPLPFFMKFGGDGPVSAKFVCGYLACDAHPFNPLIEHLPPTITAGDPHEGNMGWLTQFIRLATAESANKRPGSESVLAKLSELMFVEVVRRYLDTLPREQTGWLSGLRDPTIGKALSLLHGAPARNWTIEDIAKDVGLSRSAFAERFTELLGVPPMQYLAKWRMQVAAGLLRGGNLNIAAVAAETGYGSEAAFSRAFKKVTGMSPSLWRGRPQPADPPLR